MAYAKPIAALLALLSVAVAGAPSDSKEISQKRPLMIDDVLKLEEFGGWVEPQVAVSPDGGTAAYLVKRSRTVGKPGFIHDWGLERFDVWMASMHGGKPQNITQGTREGIGFAQPSWSPDSKRMTVISTEGNLWLWEHGAARPRLLTGRQIRGAFNHTHPPGMVFGNTVVWLSEHMLMCAVTAEGEKPSDLLTRRDAAVQAAGEWEKAWAGKEPSASALDSGVAPLPPPPGALLLINVKTGASRQIASGDFTRLMLSPDRRFVAAFEADGLTTADFAQTGRPVGIVQKVAVFTAEGKRLESDIPATGFRDLYSHLMHWSPDSRRVAAVGPSVERGERAFWLCELKESSFRPIPIREVAGPDTSLDLKQIRGFVWSRTGDLYVYASERTQVPVSGDSRKDWWKVGAGNARKITGSIQNADVPDGLLALPDGSFLGTGDEKLWRVSSSGAAPLNTEGSLKISEIVWPRFTLNNYGTTLVDDAGQVEKIIVQGVREGAGEEVFTVEWKSGQVKPISKPAPEAEVLAVDPRRGLAAFHSNTRDGSFLWLTSPDGAVRNTITANQFLGQIAEGRPQVIDYIGLDGEKRIAWLLLPPEYQPGRRYPVLTWIYPSPPQKKDKPDDLLSLNNATPFNLQLAAAQGYAVLVPTMMDDEPANGVLPAVDKAVALGYADPQRVVVWGHSHGSYCAFRIVTVATPFKAAISSNGWSNFASNSGAFLTRFRYFDFAHQKPAGHSTEAPPGKPGALEFTMRWSPVHYTDQVKVPLLILHSDMDPYFSVDQGEEFFTALYRQHKRARFVRYFGEGHVNESPANIRDMWGQVFAWADEFCDVSRNDRGEILWDGGRVKSRDGASALKPEAFLR